MNRRLYRSPDDRVLAGVAGGMAETYDLDPSVVRVLWALLILLTGGLFLLLYMIMALVVPLRPAGSPVGFDDVTQPWAAGARDETPEAPPDATSATPGPAPAAAPPRAWQPPRERRTEDRDNSGPLILGAILIIAGAFFLLRQYVDIDFGRLWPIVVIVVGLALITSAFVRRPRRG